MRTALPAALVSLVVGLATLSVSCGKGSPPSTLRICPLRSRTFEAELKAQREKAAGQYGRGRVSTPNPVWELADCAIVRASQYGQKGLLVAAFPADGRLEVHCLRAGGRDVVHKASWSLEKDVGAGPSPDDGYIGDKLAMELVTGSDAAAELWYADLWQTAVVRWTLGPEGSKGSRQTYPVPVLDSEYYADSHFAEIRTSIRYDPKGQRLYLVQKRINDGTFLYTLSLPSGSWTTERLTDKVLLFPQIVPRNGGRPRLFGVKLGDGTSAVLEETDGKEGLVSGDLAAWVEDGYALVTAASGAVNVFYGALKDGQPAVIHAYQNGDAWAQEKVELFGLYGPAVDPSYARVSACADSEGHLYVAYFDHINGLVKWADNSSGVWRVHTLCEGQSVGSTSIACVGGKVGIAWADAHKGAVYLAVRDVPSPSADGP